MTTLLDIAQIIGIIVMACLALMLVCGAFIKFFEWFTGRMP